MSIDPRKTCNSKSGKPYFDIEAEAIATISNDMMVMKLVIFKPTKATLERLRELVAGQEMGPLRLVDKWDDGTDDVHTNERPYSFVSLTGSGDSRKTSTFTITAYNSGM